MILIPLLALAYFLGSIPTAVWISKGIFGTDIRTYGSGNAGSTNMFRTFGFKAGIVTQLVDVGKGVLAAALPWLFVQLFPLQILHFIQFPFPFYCMLTGLAAVIGHIFPIWAGFQGGKGVNTLLGTILFCYPLAGLISLLTFVVVILFSSYVSLGSILGTLAFPVFIVLQDLIRSEPIRVEIALVGFGMLGLVVFTHRANVTRLIKGTENRAGFVDKLMGRKQKKNEGK